MPYLTLNDRASQVSSADSMEECVATRSTKSEASEATVGPIGRDIHGHVMTEYPLVKLDTEMITDTTAARLATSLLGHVLFLKNQVPLPVAQLARISNTKTKPRILKQRQDLLNSFDTISSHLETTFSALSTALARSRSNLDFPLAQAYLVFLVGPGIRTAKARVILGIDGLEKRIWGSRNDSRPSDVDNKRSDSKDNGDTEGDDTERNDGLAEEPETSDDEDCSNSSDDSDSESSRCGLVDPIPHVSRAEEEKFLQNADRFLSRVLANADANGKGMISEMAATQTHILIRAPRRFVHPAWIPSQNVNAVLDGALEEFLQGSERHGVSDLAKQRPNKVPKVEGVWITTRMGIQKPPCPASPLQEERKYTTRDEENDDLIWWSWDGKLMGFADW